MSRSLFLKGSPEQKLLFFLFKLFLIWASWKLIVLILGKQETPLDQRLFPALSLVWEDLNSFLVQVIIVPSRAVLDLAGFTAYRYDRVLWIEGTQGVVIGNYCIGIQLMYYFTLLILITPMSRKRKAAGIVAGILITFVLNIIRMTSMCVIDLYAHEYLQYAHDHIFNIVVFGTMMILYFRLIKGHGLKFTGSGAGQP